MSSNKPSSAKGDPKKTDESIAAAEPKSFLKRLNEIKETIALLLFFLGGISWVYGFFATRTQLTTFNCILSASIDFASAQIDVRYLPDKINAKGVQLSSLTDKEKSGVLTDAERTLMVQFSSEKASDEKDFADAKKSVSELKQKIESCGKI